MKKTFVRKHLWSLILLTLGIIISVVVSIPQKNNVLSEKTIIKKIKENPSEFLQNINIVTASAYTSIPRLTDNDPWVTASGTICKNGTLALSRDLITKYNPDAPFNYGDKVLLIRIYGIFIVEDTMNKRYTDRADIWIDDLESAYLFGIHEDVCVIKLGS